ncbi:hypothetical protein [Ochrobactrum chromiisoli]|uniref:Uncharacterized protein n=1 Tax=Ochrobactrum chromiisoli TaxID=2993941 RepID=A0ABT3QUW8_9HYPH|nr:hypothetical protein [Ochrobactrum chromiisoli]MCX2699290.1 hypothetical protein [Ochrobactrum chromiisoli]
MDVNSWDSYFASAFCYGFLGWCMGLGYAHVQKATAQKKDETNPKLNGAHKLHRPFGDPAFRRQCVLERFNVPHIRVWTDEQLATEIASYSAGYAGAILPPEYSDIAVEEFQQRIGMIKSRDEIKELYLGALTHTGHSQNT